MEDNRKRTTVTLNIELSFRNSDLIINPSPQTHISSIVMCGFILNYTWILSQPLFNPPKAQFFHILSTNLLYWAHWAHNPTLLGLDYKPWPYNISLQKLCSKIYSISNILLYEVFVMIDDTFICKIYVLKFVLHLASLNCLEHIKSGRKVWN